MRWSQRAVEDLLVKVHDPLVARTLHKVARVALDDHFAPDGGIITREDGGIVCYWRRGLLPAERERFDNLEALGEEDEPGIPGERALDYLLLYSHVRGGWKVFAVKRLLEIAALLAEVPDGLPGAAD